MSLHAQFDRRIQFLLQLANLSPEGQQDAFMNEVIENGGTYLPPQGPAAPTHMFEIYLHGVQGFGATEAEAIRSWTKAARALSGPPDGAEQAANALPFPNPRNHFEEIANLRALHAQTNPAFHCPEWPSCACPGGTSRPECPALAQGGEA